MCVYCAYWDWKTRISSIYITFAYTKFERYWVWNHTPKEKIKIWKLIVAGLVPTFLKSFRSVLERGPSARLFHSCSFFPYRSVPFLVEEQSSRSVLFLVFLVEERFHPPVPFFAKKIEGGRLLYRDPRQMFCGKELVKKVKNDDFIIKRFSRPKIYLNYIFKFRVKM